MREKLTNGREIPAKVLVSILFGGVGYLGSLMVDSTDAEVVLGVAISLFIGGLAFVVQFLHDVDRRLDKQAAATDQRISDGFNKINEATELFSLVEASALKTDAMTQLVRNSTRIQASPPLVFEFAQAEITRLSDMLKMLSEGAVTYEGEDRDWLLGIAKVATSSIYATSLTTVDAGGGRLDGGLWTSDLGHRYLDVQRDAIRRGVVIRRIFIIDLPELMNDPQFVSVFRLHAGIGIAVRVLDPSSIPATPRASLFDFVIFDGVLSYQTTPAARVGDETRPVILNTQLVTRQAPVQDRIQRFHDLWESAQVMG